jgi:cysteinyl-tRNA synthetase
MALRFYNTLTRRKQVFRPLRKGEARIYTCGPTVYDYAHIGNFRAYMLSDLLRRYLEWKGFRVKQVMNITDVGHMTIDDAADSRGEDKIEKRAREERKTPREIADFYTEAFLRDWRTLNLKEPMARPRATGHVRGMIGVIKQLIRNGHAYEANGSVYFHVPGFPRYGRLSGNTIRQLKAGAGGRVGHNPEKKNQLDFALWVSNPRHMMQWRSPWGRGYPGWHIECSAMSMELLGKTLDIHTGGEDNIFPHHECEIAQSEGATGKAFVRCWMHTRHLVVEGRKMSKRLGNFYRLRDLLEKGHDPMAIRYLLLSAHYRTRLNLTEKSLHAAENTVKRIKAFVQDMSGHKPCKPVKSKRIDGYIRTAREKFERAMDDDLGMPDALPAVFSFMSRVYRERDAGRLSREDASRAYGFMIDIDRVLGLGLERVPVREEIPDDVRLMADERENLRKRGDFSKADAIRQSIRRKGFVIEDTPRGPRIRRA